MFLLNESQSSQGTLQHIVSVIDSEEKKTEIQILEMGL